MTAVFTKPAAEVFAPTTAGGANRGPDMGEAQTWGVEVEAGIVAAAAGMVVAATWAGLNAIAGTRAGQPGRVTGADAGTHTDPVVGGTVANVGEYAWSLSPAGWRRVGDYNPVTPDTITEVYDAIALKADEADLSAEESARIAADSAIQSELDATQLDLDAAEATLAIVDERTELVGNYETLDEDVLRAAMGFDENGLMRRTSADVAEGFASVSFVTKNNVVYGDYETLDDSVSSARMGFDASDVLRRYPDPTEDIIDQHPSAGEHHLRGARARMRMIQAGEDDQLKIAIIGDSFLYATTRTTGPVTADLIDFLGDAGPGYILLAPLNLGAMPASVGFPNANSTGYTVALTGGWALDYFHAVPSIVTIEASGTATITVTGAATPVLSAAVLHFVATADGSAQYRWNGGSWHILDLTGSGPDTVAIETDMPVSGAWTLEIEWVFGTVNLAGIALESAGNGVRIDKLAQPGTNVAQWVGVDATQFMASLATLEPDAILIMHGTNSQNSHAPDVFAGYMETLISRCKTAVPTAGILVVMPPENMRDDNTYAMADYAAEVRALCQTVGAAFLDLQYYFGDAPVEYGSTGLQFFDETTDETHPTVPRGGLAMADPILRLIKYSL
jgi:hypothetical protein